MKKTGLEKISVFRSVNFYWHYKKAQSLNFWFKTNKGTSKFDIGVLAPNMPQKSYFGLKTLLWKYFFLMPKFFFRFALVPPVDFFQNQKKCVFSILCPFISQVLQPIRKQYFPNTIFPSIRSFLAIYGAQTRVTYVEVPLLAAPTCSLIVSALIWWKTKKLRKVY